MAISLNESRSKELDRLNFASFGFFLILIGVIFLATPNLIDKIVDFFKDFKLVEVYTNIYFPAPKSNHPVFYTAIAEFCIAFGLFQLAILVLRIYFKDYLDRKAGTLSGAVFWLGAGYLVNALSAEIIKDWFVFLSELIIVIGASLVVRSILILLFETVLRKS